VASNTERVRRIEAGEQVVVGVNRFTETAPSPLAGEESILKVDPAVEAATERLRQRDDVGVEAGGHAREPMSRTSESRLDLVGDHEHAVLARQPAEFC